MLNYVHACKNLSYMGRSLHVMHKNAKHGVVTLLLLDCTKPSKSINVVVQRIRLATLTVHTVCVRYVSWFVMYTLYVINVFLYFCGCVVNIRICLPGKVLYVSGNYFRIMLFANVIYIMYLSGNTVPHT